MPIVDRPTFATMCGKPQNYIGTNVLRNKIAVHGDKGKLIDTENPLNKAFLKNCKKLNKGTTAKKPATNKPIEKLYKEVVEPVQPTEKIFSEPESKESKQKREEQNDRDGQATDWDLKKKKFEALRSEQLAEKERLNVEKMQGKSIPIDLHKAIVKINIQSILHTYTSDAINQASIYCDILAGGDRAKLAEITDKLQQHLNVIIRRVEATAAKEIENLIEEYAETRSRGEKK